MANTDEIRWQRGTFLKFYAKMKIRIGGANPMEILQGDEFEYDGTILKYAGSEIPSPGVRSAVREGWATQNDSDEPSISAFRPSRKIASAQSINRDLSRVQRDSADDMDTDHFDEETVFDVADRRPDGDKNLRARPNVMTRDHNQRGRMSVNPDVASSQDGVTVGRVRSAARIKHDVTDPRTDSAIQGLEQRGLGRPEMFTRGPVTTQREGVTIKTNMGGVDPGVNLSQEDQGVEIGRVRKTARGNAEGIEVVDTSNIRDKKPAKAGQKPAPAKAKKVDTSLPPQVRIARNIDPNFPSDWSFTGKLAERIARVKKHGPTPEFLDALYAAEGDQMRKALVKAFPKQFGG